MLMFIMRIRLKILKMYTTFQNVYHLDFSMKEYENILASHIHE